MLRVIVEIHPFGDVSTKRTIATLDIANVSELAEVSNYVAQAHLEAAPARSVSVEGHRRASGWVPLVRRVLEALEEQRQRLPDALGPLPEWLWIGRVVRCAHGVTEGFEGEAVVLKHGRRVASSTHGMVLVREPQGREAWYRVSELTPSGGG